ncbi:hypothetical protein H6G81_30895 [Scytonema hofmannii FACHB-248]|uniref:Uncharacterized protein n=1 Tax=Scytonema hofmannii FACHB-248 TaxID=1842502 RepID=A0ABR8GZW7_9CYAN|nr:MULTISPECIES: hypothetical protein [Nostocales]MBD2608809.1 hypothetical protein [Scytonema hofmannii FACHB-248]
MDRDAINRVYTILVDGGNFKRGKREKEKGKELLPMPNAQCPLPIAQCPT